MPSPDPIPVFTLFGETGQFPDVVHCERFSARAPEHGWTISPHRHAQMVQIFLVADGLVRADADASSHALAAGAFLFLPANCVHGFTFRPDTEGLVVSIPLVVANSMGPAGPDLADALARPVVGQVVEGMTRVADLLASVLAVQSPFRATVAVALAHALLAMVADRAVPAADARGRARDGRMSRLDQLLAQHMAKGWGAAEYAAALSMTPGHLSRLCRAATGRGAAAYIELAAIEEACRLLAFTRLSVSEVGYRTGFADPSYFSRRFRQARQVSPSDYRARLTG